MKRMNLFVKKRNFWKIEVLQKLILSSWIFIFKIKYSGIESFEKHLTNNFTTKLLNNLNSKLSFNSKIFIKFITYLNIQTVKLTINYFWWKEMMKTDLLLRRICVNNLGARDTYMRSWLSTKRYISHHSSSWTLHSTMRQVKHRFY